jgi:hypothetical protein
VKAYVGSPQQLAVNTWFADTSMLKANAPLRNYAVKNTALSNLGSESNVDIGFSQPVPGSIGATGDDIAFLPSAGEFFKYCSIRYEYRGYGSSTEAKANFNYLPTTPVPAPVTVQFDLSRSPFERSGGATLTIAILLNSNSAWGSNKGLIGVLDTSAQPAPYAFRPVMWVYSGTSGGAALFENR